jgi:Tol biopolymer transport system component
MECADSYESQNYHGYSTFGITSGTIKTCTQIRLDQTDSQSLWVLCKIVVGTSTTAVIKLDLYTNREWIYGFNFPPIKTAFAVAPNGSKLFFWENAASLNLYVMNAQDGSMDGVLTNSNFQFQDGHRLFPIPDNSGIYFTGNKKF